MGSEQSSQSGRSHAALRSASRSAEHQRTRSVSPGPSISSDSDIPYVPYTVNRPIGDSPKLSSKSPAHGLRVSATPSPHCSPKPPRPKSYAGSTSGNDIIVVKEAIPSLETLETDLELIKLQKIPTFQPIMRAALNLPTARDPEILDKLDNQVIYQLCKRYQEHLRHCAEVVSSDQNNLAGRIREIDFAIVTLTNLLTEKQKKFLRYSEQLGKVQEISAGLKKCQVGLSEVVTMMDSLNSMLPPEQRLEPFAIMTG